jgi:hypothetical protein
MVSANGSTFPVVLRAVVGDLGGDGVRMDFNTMAKAAIFQSAASPSATTERSESINDSLPQLSEIHAFQVYARRSDPEAIAALHHRLESMGFRCESSFYERGREHGLLMGIASLVGPLGLLLGSAALWSIAVFSANVIRAETPVICR